MTDRVVVRSQMVMKLMRTVGGLLLGWKLAALLISACFGGSSEMEGGGGWASVRILSQ